MAISQEEREFAAHVVDLMHGLGLVRTRSMFGGFGVYLDDLMIGLIADGTLYLKVDSDNREHFTARGLTPFTYDKQGQPMEMSYYLAPEEALEDSEAMAHWSQLAHGAAQRAAAKKKKKKKN